MELSSDGKRWMDLQAYLCVSLDHTGVFAYIAGQVTRKAGTGGHKVVRSSVNRRHALKHRCWHLLAQRRTTVSLLLWLPGGGVRPQ